MALLPVELLNKFGGPVCEAAGNTLAAVWNISFGWIDGYDQKISARRKVNMEKFEASIRDELQSISPEHIVEPKLSVIGPALESSKYYFEEDDLRNMFAKLVASSMNAEKQSRIHPSFTHIIQNLSNVDAIFVKYLKDNHLSEIPSCKLRLQDRSIPNTTSLFAYATSGFTLNEYLVNFILKTETSDYKLDFSSTIDNLIRLRILNYQQSHFTNLNRYMPFLDNPLYLQTQSFLEEKKQITSTRELTFVRGHLKVTDFGKDFISVCVE